MIWVFASLMIVGLWLVLRTKQPKPRKTISKYQARQRERNRKHIRSLVASADVRRTNRIVGKYQAMQEARSKKEPRIPRDDDKIPTEEEREVLREEYARQRVLAEIRERAEIEAKGYNRY